MPAISRDQAPAASTTTSALLRPRSVTTPAARPPAPRSYTVTVQPACASRHAIPRPTTPAPMTTVFGRCDGTTIDALMTDSLHRASPARFSGFVLSRRPPTPGACRTAPQPRRNFKPTLAAMQGFSAEGATQADEAPPPPGGEGPTS